VIKSFRHSGVERFFRSGSIAGIQPKHAGKLRVQLFALDNAKRPSDMNAPGGFFIVLKAR
jgi:toxin HigB-1